jgi:hypothetical protein
MGQELNKIEEGQRFWCIVRRTGRRHYIHNLSEEPFTALNSNPYYLLAKDKWGGQWHFTWDKFYYENGAEKN